MDKTTILALVIGSVIPILNGLITKWDAYRGRAYLQLVLNGANGFLIEWLARADDTTFDLGHAVFLSVTSLVVAISTQAGVWKPIGVSDAVKASLVK